MNNLLLFISTFVICLVVLFGWQAVVKNDNYNNKMLSVLKKQDKKENYKTKGAKLEGGNVCPKRKRS